MRIITIIYHIYIECELYNLVYKKPSYFVELELINSTMGHCKDQYSFKRKVNIIYDFYLWIYIALNRKIHDIHQFQLLLIDALNHLKIFFVQ